MRNDEFKVTARRDGFAEIEFNGVKYWLLPARQEVGRRHWTLQLATGRPFKIFRAGSNISATARALLEIKNYQIKTANQCPE